MINYTLQELIAAIQAQTVTLNDGALAWLTRNAYQNLYINFINSDQYVPILYYNIENKQVSINNATVINFTSDDLFSANDWICLNSPQFQS